MSEVPIFKFAIRSDLQEIAEKFLPTRGEPFATGWDVCAAQIDRKDLIIRPGQYFKIPLGFRALPPENWWFELHPRSSSFAKKYMHNLIGIIDEHYSQEVLFAGQYIPDINSMGHDLVIKFGDKIGQILPFKRVDMKPNILSNEEYDDLCSKRMAVRQGGFGSTDIK
jgi:dUTPase